MPGPFVPNQTPEWLKPENASVTDSALTKAMRMIGHAIGADNPTSQVLGLMMSEVPSGPNGGIAGALERLTEKASTFIKAYHGSPHDFERFSMEKIGTGEGAQAYGHGLYFAENQGTAAYYKDALSRQAADPRDGVNSIAYNWLSVPGGARPMTAEDASSLMGDIETLRPFRDRKDIAANIAQFVNGHRELGGEVSDEGFKAMRFLDRQLPEPPKGKMYEVAIKADPEHFLDWDKPLSQQSEQVKQALANAFGEIRPRDPSYQGELTGSGVYQTLTAQGTGVQPGTPFSQDRLHQAAARTGEQLRNVGIPGIKYLDQGSRITGGVNKLGDKWFFKGSMTPYATQAEAEKAAEVAGGVTRNYVVFDDKLVDILKKYGVAGAAIEGLRRKAQAQGGSVTQDDIVSVQ